jgi:hypothetical protein
MEPAADAAGSAPGAAVVTFVAADGGVVEFDAGALQAAPECLLAALAAGRLPATRDAAGHLAVGVSAAALRAAAALLSPAGAPSSSPELASELDYLNIGGTPAAQRAAGAPPDAVLLWFGGSGGGDAGTVAGPAPVVDSDAAPLQLAAVRDLCAAAGVAVAATPQLVAGTFALRLACEPGCEGGGCGGRGSAAAPPLAAPPPPPAASSSLSPAVYRGVRWLPHEAAFEAFLPLAREAAPPLPASSGGGSGPSARTKAQLLGRPQPVGGGTGVGGTGSSSGSGFQYYVAPVAPRRDALPLGLYPTAHEAARAHDAAVLRAARRFAGRLRADGATASDGDDDGPLFAAASASTSATASDLAGTCKSDNNTFDVGDDVRALLNFPVYSGSDPPSVPSGAASDAPLFGKLPGGSGAGDDGQRHAVKTLLPPPPVGPLAVTAHLLAAALGWPVRRGGGSSGGEGASLSDASPPPLVAAAPLPSWAQRAAAVTPPPPHGASFGLRPSHSAQQHIPARGLPAALAAAVASPAAPPHHACLRAVAGVAVPPGGRKVVVYRCAVTTAASAADARDASLLLCASVPTLPAYASPHPLAVAVRVAAQWPAGAAAAAAVAVDAAITLLASDGVTQQQQQQLHQHQLLRLRAPAPPAASTAPTTAVAACVLATPPPGGVSFCVSVRCSRAAGVDDDGAGLASPSPSSRSPQVLLLPRVAVTVLLAAYEEGAVNTGALMEQHAFVTEVPVLG